TVTQDAARQVMTGQAQAAGHTTATNFKTNVICTNSNVINVLFDCANGIYVDVQSYPSFAGIVINSQIDAAGNFDPTTLAYQPGNSCDIVVARLFYQWRCSAGGLLKDRSGIAATEFAVIVPITLVMFFGTLESFRINI